MKELLNEVDKAIQNEYDRAKEKFGPYHNSPHEGYAVILEEVEEAEEDRETFRHLLEWYWSRIKKNDASAYQTAVAMEKVAAHAAAEWIQAAAMCRKAIHTAEIKAEAGCRG